jgi:hypothetical protein
MRVWPRREVPPLIWCHFCTAWLGLSRTKSDQFWQALTVARWSRAVELRSAIQCREAFPHGREALKHLTEETMAPEVLMQVLEDLITEKVIAARVARTIEEHVLQRTQKEGGWQ